MAQIGFTAKTEHVYDRFNKMQRDYVEKHGRTYAPGFLTVLMDKWEEAGMVASAIDSCMQSLPNVSLRAYIADAETNDQVVIKDGSCRYMTESTMAGANFFLTDYKKKAMVFDNRDQATAFLRQCGHEIGNWIIEPA